MDQLQINRFETASLYGKRLAIITDADKYGGSVEVFKAVTGQDPLRFERKNKQQGTSFIFQGMVIVAANQPVQYKDQSTAMSRRRIPIHIDKKLDEKKRDDDLGDKMAVEIPPLIYNLVQLPEEHIKAVLADRENRRIRSIRRALTETNVLAEWLNENIIHDPSANAKIGVVRRDNGVIQEADNWLYPNYVQWADETGRKAQVALNTFRKTVSELLQNMGIDHQAMRTRDGSVITNIRLRKHYDDAPTLVTRETAE
jgi:putative DNA primase/helicase